MSDLQQLLDGIPPHRGQGLRLSVLPEGIRIDGCLGEESARGRGMGQAHGGSISALLDTAATFVLVVLDGRPWSTVDLRVDYLRPVPLGDITVLGSVVRAGRTVARSRADLLDSEGRCCATAVGTFLA